MAKILISEALKLVDISKSTLYRDVAERKFSWDKDERGRKVVDPAELERFYGKLKTPDESDGNSQRVQMGQNGNGGIVTVLEKQIDLLESQLEKAGEREVRLLDMLETEQKKTETLLLEYKPESQPVARKKTQSLSSLNAALIGCGVVITIALVFVAWVLPHLG